MAHGTAMLKMEEQNVDSIYSNILECRHCEAQLPCGANPVLTLGANAKILIIGQAPGLKVHQSGIPWNDQSGRELRSWLGVSEAEFYNVDNFAILPMGFCYPGKGKNGDLPPRPECAALWHGAVLPLLKNIKLTLLIGKYAQQHYLSAATNESLTGNVRNFEKYLPDVLPLPHPSPRNFIWKAKNPWFKEEVLPVLQTRVKEVLYGERT
ncbi:uracil-DNA glycosylase [Sphingobacterium allocomposti]|uniref:Uracil-DNA glycosylase n=1 Tax=Sphingobacterium allocomposti TaxID=415956 RepID=A0A5S5D4T1_9SPHI|nr:uracil-DNA glycosylase family protein [Sphingobacterium composti Yoo et al. 2007 non Ten et al. 2007]TYP91043.1 uracil-DNA glycosylase [Sphingobacterium composti Yoo et al. 2007 non Ten et al. 2007]